MPKKRKRKSHYGRDSADQKRMRVLRQNETEEQTAHRQSVEAERHREMIANETSEHRSNRLAAKRARDKIKRISENEERYVTRQQRNAESQRLSRGEK